jgi:hypothetical protein
MAAAGQEVVRLAHQLGIAGEVDLAGAGARAAADLIEQAGAGCGFQKKPSVQERIKNARCSAVMVRPTAPADGERSEIPAGPRLRAAMLEDLRRPVVAGDQDIGKRFVVAQLHIEARPQLFDQIGFQQQRFGLGGGGDDFDRYGGCDHAQDARRQRRVDAGVGRKAFADVLRLADVQHVAGGIEHAVDAGRGRRQPHRVFNCGMADRERALGHRLGGLLRHFRQTRLFVFLCGRRRGIEVRGRQVRRGQVLRGRVPRGRVLGGRVLGRQIRSGTPPRLACGLRMVVES